MAQARASVLQRELPPIRSMLFIPANRTVLAPKGLAAGADALIFDLEDAVPHDGKDAARSELADFLAAAPQSSVPVFVRINELHSLAAYDDLRAIVGPNLAGVFLPKVESPNDVVIADRVIGWLEAESGVEPGSIVIVPILETAPGIRRAFEIAQSSARTAFMGALGVKGGDVERSLGYRWSAGGEETYAIRSTVLLELRAAAMTNPVTGLWSSIKDLDGLAAFAAQSRSIGYEGMLAIHPSHVPIINEAFTPTAAEIDHDRRLVNALASAALEGRGAITVDGEMVDEAMAATARRRLARYGLAGSPESDRVERSQR